jgi:galactokinase/galacturonokinase
MDRSIMQFASLSKQKDELVAHLSRRERFATGDLSFVVSPYRISPLGAHIDHQGGPVLGMTIDAYTLLAFMRNEEKRIRLYSINYPGVLEFNLERIRATRKDDWGRYAKGAAKVLGEKEQISYGFIGAVSGTLPASGLSSSASVGLAYLHALAKVNALEFSPIDYVELDRRLENDYLKLKNGILDQATIVHSQKDHLLHINTITGDVESFPQPDSNEDVRILVVYSGFSRELTSSGFNTRVEECQKAATLLGIMGGVRSAKILSDVPIDVFHTKSRKLPEDLRRRAFHYYSEVERVAAGVNAWKDGDWKTFGKLMNESCISSLKNYESGSPALQTLQEIVSNAPGVYGSRFSGGGYGGCVIGFAKTDVTGEAATEIYEKYINQYPEVKGHAAVYLASSDDGVRFL